jgi:hypothetical protein
MSVMPTEYICTLTIDRYFPDADRWTLKLLEMGLHRESFVVTPSSAGTVTVRFWEPDRSEALRMLAKLDGMRMSPAF